MFELPEKGLWVVQVDLGKGADGKRKRIRKYAKTRVDAETLKAKIITEHSRGIVKTPTSTLLGDWLTDFVCRKNQTNTNTTKKEDDRLLSKILPVVGHIKLQALTALNVREVLTHLQQDGAAIRTQRKALSLLKGALDEAVTLDVIPRNPVLSVKLPKEKQERTGAMWEPHEVQQFLGTLQKDRYFYMYRLALGIGARIGEIQALKVGDFDPVSGTLSIERTVSGRPYNPKYPLQITAGKTFNAVRTLTLPADLHQELRDWLHRKDRRKNEWLFPSQTGDLIPYSQIWHHFKRHTQKAGVASITIHDMRRTFINLCARQGIPLEIVAKIVGHGDWATITKIYRMVHENEMRKHTPTLAQLTGETPEETPDGYTLATLE